jgi:hypothetical protein
MGFLNIVFVVVGWMCFYMGFLNIVFVVVGWMIRLELGPRKCV